MSMTVKGKGHGRGLACDNDVEPPLVFPATGDWGPILFKYFNYNK